MNPPPTGGLRFDARPLGVLLVTRGWRILVLIVVLVGLAMAMAASRQLPDHAPSGVVTGPALRAIAIFAAAVTLWITSAVPLVVSGIGVFVALSLSHLTAESNAGEATRLVATWFADPIVFFLLGAFLIAASLSSAHVIDHLALRLLDSMGTSARRLRQLLYWSAFFAAFIMSEHAVTAMLFPLAVRIRDALKLRQGSSTYLQGLFIGLAWGATIGGIVTYLGGSRNPLAMGFLQHRDIPIPGFFELLKYSLPVALPLALIAALLLEWAFPVDIKTIAAARDSLAERRRELGRFGTRQLLVSLIMAAAVAVWTIAGYQNIAVVALAAAALLLGSGLVRWKELQREVPWDLLLLYAAALALAKALTVTGSPALIAGHLLPILPHQPLVAIAIICTTAMLLTEAMSHGAVVSMLVPLLLGAAPSLGLDPVIVALAVALPTGLAFMLPMGSPPLAIAFASGEFPLSLMTRWGALLNALAVPVVVLAYYGVWKHLRGM
jgi:sodium-dependent dicarboxylate transporter 2/3/5